MRMPVSKENYMKYCNSCIHVNIKATEFPCSSCSMAEDKEKERNRESKKDAIKDTIIFHAEQIVKILVSNGYNLNSVKEDNYKSIDIGVHKFGDKEYLKVGNIVTKIEFEKEYKKGEFDHET